MKFILPHVFNAKLISKSMLNEKTVSFWFAPIDAEFTYFAGQFVMVYFPDPDSPETILNRAYSIASAPKKDGSFELCVEYIPEGKGSSFFKALNVGDTIEMKAPYGMCYIKPENKNDLVMVGTGTGFAPIKGILEELAEQKDTRQIDVLFGTRYAEDLFYLGELKELAEKLDNIRIIITLSRPNDSWLGYEGRVTAHLHEIEFNPENTDFYICGNTPMIKDVREFALNAGIGRRNIHVEIFD